MPERSQSCSVPARNLNFELSGIDFFGEFSRDIDRMFRRLAAKSVTLITPDRSTEDKFGTWLFESTPADAFVITRNSKFTLERCVPDAIHSNGQGVSVSVVFERIVITEAAPDPFENL